jgi:hypothetical protein
MKQAEILRRIRGVRRFANLEPLDPKVRIVHNQEISVTKQDRLHAGSCNACTAGEYKTVVVVHLRNHIYRLCPACQKKLKSML